MTDFSPRNIKIWSRLGPSGALGFAASELAKENPNVLMLTADLCYFSGLERFQQMFPTQFYNLGIAEQNMIGVACGLAKEGFIPFANTYASFCSSRCADQVRVNMSYMKQPIKLIGLTAGFGAGILGATHMSVEDIAFMRALPNIEILSPADCTEIVKCMMAAAKSNNPTYIRLTGTQNMTPIYCEDYDFQIGKAITLVHGEDVCIIATGAVLSEGLKAAELLSEAGISCTVMDMHTIKPLDVNAVHLACTKHRLIVTVEEHSVYGGLGSAVAEFMAQKSVPSALEIIGINDVFPPAGDYNYQIAYAGLNAESIKKKIENAITRMNGGKKNE